MAKLENRSIILGKNQNQTDQNKRQSTEFTTCHH